MQNQKAVSAHRFRKASTAGGKPFHGSAASDKRGKTRWLPGAVSSWPLHVSGERAQPSSCAALTNSRASPGQLGDPGFKPGHVSL